MDQLDTESGSKHWFPSSDTLLTWPRVIKLPDKRSGALPERASGIRLQSDKLGSRIPGLVLSTVYARICKRIPWLPPAVLVYGRCNLTKG